MCIVIARIQSATDAAIPAGARYTATCFQTVMFTSTAQIRIAAGAAMTGARHPQAAYYMLMIMCILVVRTPHATEQGVVMPGLRLAIHTRTNGSM